MATSKPTKTTTHARIHTYTADQVKHLLEEWHSTGQGPLHGFNIAGMRFADQLDVVVNLAQTQVTYLSDYKRLHAKTDLTPQPHRGMIKPSRSRERRGNGPPQARTAARLRVRGKRKR